MADIDFGQISEALNNKADRDLHNVDTTTKADAVIDYQVPTEANGYTWYRKYKSGWVEQGGISDGNYNTIITLPVVMSDNNYYINASCFYETSNVATATVASLNDADITTTTIRIQRRLNGNGSNGPVRWQVSGMAAA